MNPAGPVQLQKLFENIIGVFGSIAFIALVVLLTWAGIRFITSGGDPKAIASASQTITWALLGMLFLVIAWLGLVLIEQFTGVQVTKFCLGFPAPSDLVSKGFFNNCK